MLTVYVEIIILKGLTMRRSIIIIVSLVVLIYAGTTITQYLEIQREKGRANGNVLACPLTYCPAPPREPTKATPDQGTSTWTGEASYYWTGGCLGCSANLTMANGQTLDDEKLTIAFMRLPLGSFVEVTNLANQKTVTAEVTDTGGFEKIGRIADLNKAVKEAIECSSLCQVKIKAL